MRIVSKLLGTLIAGTLIVGAFPAVVSADRTIEEEGCAAEMFEYILYSDGEMYITVKSDVVDFTPLSETLMDKVDSVTVDISLLQGSNPSLIIYGGGCSAEELSFVNSKGSFYLFSLDIVSFENVSGDDISFQNKSVIQNLDLMCMPDLNNLDFVDDIYATACVTLRECYLGTELIYDAASADELAIIDNQGLEYIDVSESGVFGLHLELCPDLTTVIVNDSSYYLTCNTCPNLKSIDLPDELQRINAWAFENSGLTYVNIPKSVTEIDYGGFGYCADLKTVILHPTTTMIYSNAFISCYDLQDVYFCGSKEDSEKVLTDTGIAFEDLFNFATIHYDVKPGWYDTGDNWVYFDESYDLATGWKQISGKWYLFDNDGVMQKGWQQVDDKWYYLESSGAMKTGWLSSSEGWYYLKPDGSMATSWQKVNDVWYYFTGSGIMVTDWNKIDGIWYYFKPSGAMAANEYVNGYWLNSDGSWTYKYKASWKQDKTGWWYGDTSGWYAKSQTLRIDGKDYNFNSAGYCTNP